MTLLICFLIAACAVIYGLDRLEKDQAARTASKITIITCPSIKHKNEGY